MKLEIQKIKKQFVPYQVVVKIENKEDEKAFAEFLLKAEGSVVAASEYSKFLKEMSND